MSEDLVIGQTYSREEINTMFGAPVGCECRIVVQNADGSSTCECSP
jgi:hypothetical protein